MKKTLQYCIQTNNLETGKINLHLLKADSIFDAFKKIGLIPVDSDPNAAYKLTSSTKIEVLYSEPVD